MSRDLAPLRDMLEAATKIREFTSGLTREAFLSDELTHLAIIRLIEVIGEAARQISAEFRASHPEIPWRAIIGMRNELIHAYRHVNLDNVWQVATDSVPELIAQLDALIPPANDLNDAG